MRNSYKDRIKTLEDRLEARYVLEGIKQNMCILQEELRAIQEYLRINIVHHVTVAKEKEL